MVGPNAARFKDGKSLKRERARLSKNLKIWRIQVFRRDGYKCKHCGTNRNLHGHHIKSWAEHPLYRFDIDNGITLCEVCHGILHKKDFTKRKSRYKNQYPEAKIEVEHDQDR